MAYVRAGIPTSSYGGSPRTFSLGGAVGSGNSLFIFVEYGFTSGGFNVSVSDDASNSYTLESFSFTNQYGDVAGLFRLHNITNGPTQLSVSWSGGGEREVLIAWQEHSNLQDSAPTSTNAITNTGSPAAITLNPTTDGETLIACMIGMGSRDVTPTSGAGRFPATGASEPMLLYNEDAGTAGSKSLGGTWSGGGNAWIHGASYRAASGGPPPPSSSIIVRSQRIVGAW